MYQFKISFSHYCGSKKGRTTNFSPSSFVAVDGSGITRKVKQCKLALLQTKFIIIYDYPTCVEIDVGSGSASKWKVGSG
jgi:hypothetical protein